MGSRARQLRERHRRIFGWSMAAAVVVHVAVFRLDPAFRAGPLGGADPPPDTVGVAAGANASVDLIFGPPLISLADGGAWQEPPERVLEAERDVRLPPQCASLAARGRTPLDARLGLRIRASGRADVLGLQEGTGDPCGDQVVKEAAGALWYHWLPSERFPAPVELVQPVTLVGMRR